MDGNLKKKSKNLYGVCICIIVLMVICYFGVSNSKGTYSATPTCDNGTTPKKISGKYYCCASGYNAISTSSGVKCIVNGYTASDLNTSNNTCTKSATGSTTKISSKSSSGAAVTTTYTCTADGKAEVAKKLGYNSDECSCTSVTVGLNGTAPTSISVTCKKTQSICTIGVRQTLDGDSPSSSSSSSSSKSSSSSSSKSSSSSSSTLPRCTSISKNCGDDTIYRNTSDATYSCTDAYTNSDTYNQKFCYVTTGSTQKCLVSTSSPDEESMEERVYFKFIKTTCSSGGSSSSSSSSPIVTPSGGGGGSITTPSSSSSSIVKPSSSSSSIVKPSSVSSSTNNNVDDNPKTGSVAIFMVWIIALGTLVYSFMYFKQSKFE